MTFQLLKKKKKKELLYLKLRKNLSRDLAIPNN